MGLNLQSVWMPWIICPSQNSRNLPTTSPDFLTPRVFISLSFLSGLFAVLGREYIFWVLFLHPVSNISREINAFNDMLMRTPNTSTYILEGLQIHAIGWGFWTDLIMSLWFIVGLFALLSKNFVSVLVIFLSYHSREMGTKKVIGRQFFCVPYMNLVGWKNSLIPLCEKVSTSLQKPAGNIKIVQWEHVASILALK